MAYCMTLFQLRFFKDTIKNLDEQLKKRLEIDLKKYKSNFSFHSKFHFKSIQPNLNALDGKTDQDKSEEVPDQDVFKIREISDFENKILILGKSDVNDIYRLKNLKDCQITINADLKTLYLENLSNCKLNCGIIDGSLFGQHIDKSEIKVVAHQIRIHHTHFTKFNVFVTSNMIVEDSKDITVTPLKPSELSPEMSIFFNDSKFKGLENKWENVKDFNWIRDDPSPNVKYVQ